MRAWKKLSERRRNHYQDLHGEMSKEEFVGSTSIQDKYGKEIEKLDKMAKRVNSAILDDSMRFNGRAPVAHAKRFHLEERLTEAIESFE